MNLNLEIINSFFLYYKRRFEVRGFKEREILIPR